MKHEITIDKNTTAADFYKHLSEVAADFGFHYTRENAANKPGFILAACYEVLPNEMKFTYGKFASIKLEVAFSRGIANEILTQKR